MSTLEKKWYVLRAIGGKEKKAKEYIESKEIFEQTHPPLGKLLIWFSTILFGFNPFGWRLMNVIFATLMIPIMYIFSKSIFMTQTAALIASTLLFVDFMHFTMGRIATPETFVTVFNLISCLFFYINYKKFKKMEKSIILAFFWVLYFSLLHFQQNGMQFLGLLVTYF